MSGLNKNNPFIRNPKRPVWIPDFFADEMNLKFYLSSANKEELMKKDE